MKIQVISLVAFIMLARPALSERLPAGDGAAARWFGVTATDLAAPEKAKGRPLKVKARFMRELTDGGGAAGQRPGKASMDKLSFLVAAEGGEIRCEMGANAKGADVVRGMKLATPVVIHGTLDPRRNVFHVDAVVQGWGRDQMEGGS